MGQFTFSFGWLICLKIIWKWKHFLRFFRLQLAQKLKQLIYLRLVEGLTGEASTVSFESTSRPGYYLCRAGNKIIIVRLNSSNSQMKKDCTFRAYSDQFFEGYVSFEVAEEPDLWVRQSNRQLQVSNINTYRQGDSSKGMRRCFKKVKWIVSLYYSSIL